MTPKEKAEKLVNKYYYDSKCNMLSLFDAKQCALIAVDVIIKEGKDVDEFAYAYWQEVETEIEKL